MKIHSLQRKRWVNFENVKIILDGDNYAVKSNTFTKLPKCYTNRWYYGFT